MIPNVVETKSVQIIDYVVINDSQLIPEQSNTLNREEGGTYFNLGQAEAVIGEPIIIPERLVVEADHQAIQDFIAGWNSGLMLEATCDPA